jgi:Cu-processing system permease protein
MNGNKILKFIILDILRNKWVITYTIFLMCISAGLMFFSKDSTKAIVSVLNVVLILVPLVSILFCSIHFYNSREFIQMLLSQPVKRSTIFFAEYTGLVISLSVSFLAGIILPLSFYGVSTILIYLALTGVFLSVIFSAFSVLISISTDEKVKGIGISLFLWLFFSVLYDGLVLLIYFAFNDYPLEKIMVIITTLNPVDLSRVLILLKLDISALMGYTGANFQKVAGSMTGIFLSFTVLIMWSVTPLYFAYRKFMKKNF